MAGYDKHFDAKAYWATKPYCSVCKSRKVKNGNVCHVCKENMMKSNINNEGVKTTIRTVERRTIDQNHSFEEKFSQIKYDKGFVLKLLDKLKVGNSRSIHLNALPGRSATRLDLFNLGEIDKKLPSEFIDTILNKEGFSFSISFDKVDIGELDEEEKKRLSLVAKRLNTLVIENEDNYLEYGIKNFGFGYPILIKRDQNDPSKIIKAPLYIWQLDVERSYQNKNNWTIKKDEDSAIKINEILISHLSRDESIKIEKISKDILDDGILDKEELLDVTRKVLQQLGADSDTLQVKLEKCPDATQIEEIANSKPWIQWSGVFGIYRSRNETIIQSTEELLERFDEFESNKLVLEQFQTASISAIDTDPSQEEIINTLTEDEFKLIQGPPGTGKSQSITAIVSNALANEAKCLIVCEKKTALDVIFNNLVKAGIGDYCVVIDDVNKDRKKVIHKAREIKESPSYPAFATKDYEIKYEKFCVLKKEVNSKNAETLRKIFGEFNWKKLIGLYLKYSKLGDLSKIQDSLDYDGLDFTHEEYSEFLSMVEEASYLFSDMEPGSDEIFSVFSKDLFISESTKSAQDKAKIEVHNFVDQLTKINEQLAKYDDSDYLYQGINIFNKSNFDSILPIMDVSIESAEQISKLYLEGVKLGGDKFNNIGLVRDISFGFMGIVNSDGKRLCKIRKDLPSLFEKILLSAKELSELGIKCCDLKNNSGKFKTYTDLHVKSGEMLGELKKLKSKYSRMSELAGELKQSEKITKSIISKKIFEIDEIDYLALGSKAAIEKHFLSLLNRLKKAEETIDSYKSYHSWMYFCSKRDEYDLGLLSCLTEYHSNEWKKIFDAWYFLGALQKYEGESTTGFHTSDSKLRQLEDVYNELGRLQINQIKSIWGNKRNYRTASAGFNFNTLYSLRKNSAGPKSSLRKIIARDFDLFTALFPVILTNPSAANAILPLEQGLFNLVIFDEASQLRISDTFTSMIRGQYKVVAGDEHQMPPSSYFQSTSETIELETGEEDDSFTEADEQAVLAEAESLLQYSSDLKNINKSNLDFHYRSKHPALIDFSNCAFYGGNLVPFPPLEAYNPIEFRAVNGRYEERTNPDEVNEVIRILNEEIHPDEFGAYPSVGIATFNINQRNLITETLNAYAEKDMKFANKLLELRECGLFVKNLENIQGDERDIIIISTTYGVQADGTFSQNFARINRIEGYKLLNVLITRAKKKLYVCTSIPRERYISYTDFIDNEGNNKRGILYAYLAYAEAVSSHDYDTAKGILERLKKTSFEKPREIYDDNGLAESPFEEEVYDQLVEQFGKDQIVLQHKVGGFRIDFVIKTEQVDVALECDGKAYHQSEESYAHDMFRQKELEGMGYKVYRIWSTSWFQDRDREMLKLIKFVETL